MGKRCICIALVLILITTIGLAPLAQPAEAVAGAVVAGAVVAVMAMAGITIVTSGMTAVQIQDWVEDKLDEWAADVGSPLDHLINSAGIGVTISGLLTIGTAAAQGINQFIEWLKNDLSLNDNSTAEVISSAIKIDNVDFGYLPEIQFYNSQRTFEQYIVLSQGIAYTVYLDSSTAYYLFYASSTDFTLIRIATRLSDGYQQAYTYQASIGSNGIYYINGGSITSIPKSQNNAPSCPYYGTYDSTNTELLISLHNDVNVQDGLSINTGVITIPQVQNDDKVFVDVGALPGSTVSEVTEGVLSDVATDTLNVSGTVAEEEPEYVITGPVSVSGLDDIFPFCIPFDLYHMLEALAADPIAPHFEWRFYVPRIVDYTIEIDLSGFNTVAQILRIMETLLFCVGLAFETRKLIRS